MNRLALLALVPVSLLAACGGGNSNTKPAPFGTPTATDPGTTTTEPPVPAQSFPTQTAKPQNLVFPDEEFRKEQPAPSEVRPFALPSMKPFTLKNGLKVFLVERHELPLISAELNFEGGSLADPVGKEGLAGVCMDLVTEGTVALDKLAFAAAQADIASSISSYASDDSQGVAMNTLTPHFDATLGLLAGAVLTPGLRADDFDRIIKRSIESVKQSKGSAASVAWRVGGPIYYGTASREGAVTTEASLSAITLDDCKTYAAKWMKPKGARLFVVGDLTEAQVRASFDGGTFAAFKGTAPKFPTVAKRKPLAGRIFFVDVPGSAQSQIGLVHAGPSRSAKDYFPTQLMSSILGGGFSSRINMNLREDKGYSYGARGTFEYDKRGGKFLASSSVRADATYQSLLELQREVAALQKGTTLATAAELERERQGAILSLPARFSTGSASLGAFRGLVYFGLPLDYYRSYVGNMTKVSLAQVNAAAKAHLDLDQAQYMVVGDGNAPVIVRDGKKDVPLLKDGKPVTLRDALTDLASAKSLGGGALVELDTDGKPVSGK